MPTINKRGIDTIMSLKKKIAAAFIACAMTLAVGVFPKFCVKSRQL